MSSATALTWFARHEIGLAWREWLAMMAGRRGRKRRAVIGLIAFAAIMHLPAYAVIGRFADLHAPLDKSSLIVITATILLAWALMLSQAIESVTRVFYARADLDLIMSSPVRLTNVFSVRIAAIALTVMAMALLLSTPFVDGQALLCLLAGSLLLLGAVMAIFSPRFAGTVVKTSANAVPVHRASRIKSFRAGSRQQALRSKEFVLLRRDPWLISQSLMQLLYLVPPALLLWRSFADSSAAIILITPVIVMAAGQLAGGLAWLTISGEDAADLVTTAPLPPSRVTRAKIEVVLIVIGVIFAPLIGALAFTSPPQAVVTAIGVVVAAATATAIQLWFPVQARRSQFRPRQTSSRLATFSETLLPIRRAPTPAPARAIAFPPL